MISLQIQFLLSLINQETKKMINEYNSNIYNTQNFYLINKKVMDEIKNAFNYEFFCGLKIPNFFENKNNLNKKLLSFIKSLPDDLLKNYIYSNNNINLKNYSEQDLVPPIINVNYYDTSEKSIMIYNDFELYDKNFISTYINNIYEINYCYLECVIAKGKIIINYENNLNEKKYVLTIGILKENNTYETQYLLIYDESYKNNINMNRICDKLNEYMDDVQLEINNNRPILNSYFNEVGTIVKYSGNNNNLNNFVPNNTNNNFINNNNFLNNNNSNNLNNLNNEEGHINKIKNLETNSNDIYYVEPINPMKSKIKDIKEYFIYPPLIGLQNIGATCYMNATLQCFCNIKNFVNFFKYHKQAINIYKTKKNTLSSSFKLLIEKLWPNNYDNPNLKKDYAPHEFKEKISSMNSLFKGVAANDAKDLVNFIIMTLHEELNKSKNVKIEENNINLDQTNPSIMFNNFAQHFMQTNQSIISDLFYGMNCNVTQCGGCGVKTYNYQTFFFLVFPLEEVRKFVQSNNQFNQFNQFNNFIPNNNVVNIYNCFDYDRKVSFLYGENSLYCNYCKRNCNSSMCTVLTTGPPILILLLNRGKGIEFNVKINFVDNLDLSQYIEYANTGSKYKLIGVITHMGESGMGGHFIAYCLEPISEEWYKYNDSIVTKVQDFQNEVINYAMPYLLFYQKVQ